MLGIVELLDNPHQSAHFDRIERFKYLALAQREKLLGDRKSTRLNSSHLVISYAVFCLKKKKSEHIGRTVHHDIVLPFRVEANPSCLDGMHHDTALLLLRCRQSPDHKENASPAQPLHG